MDEFQLIEKLKAKLPKLSERVALGIGDDTAILKTLGPEVLWTVDAQVEGVHFDLRYSRPEEIGHKALAVNLSDICAMGGRARAAVISIGVRPGLDEAFWQSVYEGIAGLARKWEVDVVGGNVTSTAGPLFIDISVLGTADKAIRRCGAKPGDKIFVTGELGGAALGLLELGSDAILARKEFPEVVARQLRPEPRAEEAAILAGFGHVSSLIDVSDGLASDLRHLAKASDVGFVLEAEKLPLVAGGERARFFGETVLNLGLSGGEDYELLGTVGDDFWPELANRFEQKGLRISLIGEIRAEKEAVLLSDGQKVELTASGWNHLLKLT